MDKHDILIVSKSDDNSIYVTTKGDIFEIAAAIKAITGGIVHHTMENRGKSDAIATASLFAEAAMKGACKGLPHNFFLSFPNSKHFPVQDIIGTVVFIKTKPLPPLDEEIYDYEVDGLSNEDVELIKKIFTEDNQAKLSKKFDEIYKDRDYWSPIVTTW